MPKGKCEFVSDTSDFPLKDCVSLTCDSSGRGNPYSKGKLQVGLCECCVSSVFHSDKGMAIRGMDEVVILSQSFSDAAYTQIHIRTVSEDRAYKK